MNHKCPNCNIELRYSENENIWICDKCNNKFSINTTSSYKLCTCKKCNLEFITNEDISKCINCKSKLQIQNFNGALNIDSYIPFKIDKQNAIKKYKNYCNSNILYPKKFKSNKALKSFAKIYIPVVLTDYIIDGRISTEAKKISEWNSGNYNYKKTDVYDVFRDGSMTLENIPISCNKKIIDTIIEEIHPYNYKELNKFSFFNDLNFKFYNPNIEITNINDESIEKAKKSFINIIKNDISGYDKVKIKDENVNLKKINMKLVLLPVWIVKIKYRKQIYEFIINGQNGKISGNIPTSKLRIFSIWIKLFIAFSFIIFLLEYLKVIS